MEAETRKRMTEGRGVSEHLEQALDCTDEQTKHYHIRQALQLHIAENDSE
ncbi:hypothetical protein [Halapricum salinum]|nr:hypothetical protein [Halapricum salinum]